MKARAERDGDTAKGLGVGLAHMPALDGLRGIAVLLVVSSHIGRPLLRGDAGAYPAVRTALRGGWIGVDIFFAISGFLITSLLLREWDGFGGVRLGLFYGRRALRLLPALYVFLVAHVVYARVAGLPSQPELQSVAAAVLYVNNWQGAWHATTTADGLGHLWSLAVEEQFYLVWPAVLLVFLRWRRALVPWLIALAIAFITWRRFQVFDASGSWTAAFIRTDTRADGLLYGALAAWCVHHRWRIARRLLPLASVASLVLAASFWRGDPASRFWYHGGLTAIAMAATVVVLAAADGQWPGAQLLAAAPLQLVGRVSYGLYIWHLPIFKAVGRHAGAWPTVARVAVALALAATATGISFVLVERPARRLRGRFVVQSSAPQPDEHRVPVAS